MTMFTLYKGQEPHEVEGDRVRGKENILWGYIGKIMVNPRT